MEENQIQTFDYSQDLLEVKESNKNIELTIKELLNFFQLEKQEQKILEEENQKEQKILEEEKQKEQKILEEEKQKEQKILDEYYSDIKTIASNTNTEVTTQLLTDVSTLMQVNIMTSGLLIGIVCISLFAKFFKR